MLFYFPVIASFLNAVSTYFEKVLFRDKSVKPRNFIPATFFLAFCFTAIFAFPLFGKISPAALSFKNIAIFIGMIILAITANYLYYYGFCREKLSEVEQWLSMSPLVTVILSSIFFASERDPRILVAAILAGIALIFSHAERHKIRIHRGSWALFGCIMIGGFEALLIKELLLLYSPVALYTIRIGMVAFFTMFLFGPPFKQLGKKNTKMIALVSLLWMVIMILTYTSYKNAGLVFTTLVLMLSQVLIYLESIFVFREKLKPRFVLAIFIILACVAYAEIIR